MHEKLITKIYSLIGEKDIKKSIEEFIKALNDFGDSIKELDYAFVESVVDLDLFLDESRNAFWSEVLQMDDIVKNLPEDIKLYISEVLKDHLSGDSFREACEKYKNKKTFRYLIARYLLQEGIDEEDNSKLEKAKKMLKSLMAEKYTDASNYDQLIYTKIDALLGQSTLLPAKEGITFVDEAEHLIGSMNITFRSPLHLYRSSLIALKKFEQKIATTMEDAIKNVENVAKNYQYKNMEILSIFMGIAAFIFGGGTIAYNEVSLHNKLVLLGTLSLSVVFAMASIVTILRNKCITYVINIISLLIVVIGFGYALHLNNIYPFTKSTSNDAPISSSENFDTPISKLSTQK